MDKKQQKKILIEIMEADTNDGLYKTKPFNTFYLREITDQYDNGEISYGKLVEILNDVAIKWHEQQAISKTETPETWDDIEEEYLKDEYPVFGGPFTNAMTPFEWLKKHYHSPKRK